MSKINRSLTREMAANILERSIAAYADGAPIHPLVAKNIMREFASVAKAALAEILACESGACLSPEHPCFCRCHLTTIECHDCLVGRHKPNALEGTP
jgi:hypothetical protein